jgi:hypothetical protein
MGKGMQNSAIERVSWEQVLYYLTVNQAGNQISPTSRTGQIDSMEATRVAGHA